MRGGKAKFKENSCQTTIRCLVMLKSGDVLGNNKSILASAIILANPLTYSAKNFTYSTFQQFTDRNSDPFLLKKARLNR